MTAQEFGPQFARLERAFRMSSDIERADVFAEWFGAVKHLHVDAVDAGVTALIRDARDTFWPAVGALMERIRARTAGQPRTQGKCATCHGNTWVPALPWKSHGQIVEGVDRCPDCGIPAPEYRPLAEQTPLTASEHQRYLAAKSEPKEPVTWPPHIQAIYDRLVARRAS